MSIVQWNSSICVPRSNKTPLYDSSPPPQLLTVPSHYRMEVELPLRVSALHSKVEEQLIRHTTMFLEMSSAGIVRSQNHRSTERSVCVSEWDVSVLIHPRRSHSHMCLVGWCFRLIVSWVCPHFLLCSQKPFAAFGGFQESPSMPPILIVKGESC